MGCSVNNEAIDLIVEGGFSDIIVRKVDNFTHEGHVSLAQLEGGSCTQTSETKTQIVKIVKTNKLHILIL